MDEPGATSPEEVRRYRLAPALVARLVGTLVVALGLLLVAWTLVVAAAGLPPGVVVVPGLAGLLAVVVLAVWLRRRAWVLRLDAQGYAVRLVRGARTAEAAWSEVEQVGTASPRGHPCVVITLAGDRQTVLPVQAVEGDREDLVRELQRRLRSARG